MSHERVFEYVANDRRVMGSMVTGEIDLRNRWGKGGAEVGTSGTAFLENLKLGSQPVRYDRADECANY